MNTLKNNIKKNNSIFIMAEIVGLIAILFVAYTAKMTVMAFADCFEWAYSMRHISYAEWLAIVITFNYITLKIFGRK